MDKTDRVFANLNNKLSFEINNHQLSRNIPLKLQSEVVLEIFFWKDERTVR